MAVKKKPDEGEGEGGEEVFSEAQLSAINGIINGAVGDHLKRKLPGIVEGSIKKPLEEIRALLAGKQGGEGEGTGEEETEETEETETRRPAGKGQPQRRAAAPDPAVAQLNKKLAKVEAERAQEKAEREAERKANRDKERDGTLRELLSGAGIDPNRLRGAVAVMRETTKYDDKTNEWLVAAGDDDLDLAAGVAAFVSTDEGKSYLAPQQGARPVGGAAPVVRSGAGTRPNGGTRAPTRPVASAADAKAAGKQAAAQELAAAVGSLLGNNVPLG
jgi:hypothetical protein